MSHPKHDDAPQASDELSGTEQPFVQHLVELRDRVLYCVYGLLLVGGVLAFFPGPGELVNLIARPIMDHMPEGQKLIAVGVLTPFIAPLKVLVMSAVLLTLPWIMYQAWQFVAPGLYKHEKRFALPLILMGSVLAFAGIAFVQFVLLDNMFAFIQGVTPASVAATPDVASYVQTILMLYIAFALAFQVPVVVILLVKFDMVSLEKLRAFRPYFAVLAFVVAAVATPPDILSQIAMGGAMLILYELGMWLAGYFKQVATPSVDDAVTSAAHTEDGV